MDVAIYARVSTTSQTVENQLIELRDAAKRLGWIISVDVNLRPRVASDVPAYLQAVREVAALADWQFEWRCALQPSTVASAWEDGSRSRHRLQTSQR